MLGIVRGEKGWHTYTLRKNRPVQPFARLPFGPDALRMAALALMRLAGKPWRRMRVFGGIGD